MQHSKKERLEKAGWKVGTVEQFLKLNSDEVAIIESRLQINSDEEYDKAEVVFDQLISKKELTPEEDTRFKLLADLSSLSTK